MISSASSLLMSLIRGRRKFIVQHAVTNTSRSYSTKLHQQL